MEFTVSCLTCRRLKCTTDLREMSFSGKNTCLISHTLTKQQSSRHDLQKISYQVIKRENFVSHSMISLGTGRQLESLSSQFSPSASDCRLSLASTVYTQRHARNAKPLRSFRRKWRTHASKQLKYASNAIRDATNASDATVNTQEQKRCLFLRCVRVLGGHRGLW